MNKIVLSCEHAENKIPEELRSLISIPENILNSHEGFDIGAKAVGETLARKLKVFFIAGKITRLAVDLNRSAHHNKLFSKYSRMLSRETKEHILDTWYFPYRNELEKQIKSLIINKQTVIHLSVHSFTPVLNGKVRNADIGILYDPQRREEVNFCEGFQSALKVLSGLNIRMNYPYKGSADGVTTGLRKKFGTGKYIGIELEINQKLLIDNGVLRNITKWVLEALSVSVSRV